MKYSEFEKQVWNEGRTIEILDAKFHRGYISRKRFMEDAQVKEGKGTRKGLYYIEMPCLISTIYHYRIYFRIISQSDAEG